MVARQHEPAGLRVPHRAGKGTAQSRDALRTPLFVAVRDQLAVRRALELMAARYELRANLGGVGEPGVGDARGRCRARSRPSTPSAPARRRRRTTMSGASRPSLPEIPLTSERLSKRSASKFARNGHGLSLGRWERPWSWTVIREVLGTSLPCREPDCWAGYADPVTRVIGARETSSARGARSRWRCTTASESTSARPARARCRGRCACWPRRRRTSRRGR